MLGLSASITSRSHRVPKEIVGPGWLRPLERHAVHGNVIAAEVKRVRIGLGRRDAGFEVIGKPATCG